MLEHTYTATEDDWDAPHKEGQKTPKRKPRVHLPVSSEQLKQAEIDGEFEITLKGKVIGMESNKRRTSIELELVDSEVADTIMKKDIESLIE